MENYRPASERNQNDREFSAGMAAEAPPSLGILAEIHQRLAATETSLKDLHRKVDDAVKSGSLDDKLLAKLAHIAGKYFPHDDPPAAEPIAPPRPRFDAFTGERLN